MCILKFKCEPNIAEDLPFKSQFIRYALRLAVGICHPHSVIQNRGDCGGVSLSLS